jgi:hypothetical protein
MIQTGALQTHLLQERGSVRFVINADADPYDYALLKEFIGKRMAVNVGPYLYYFTVDNASYEGSWLVVETTGHVNVVSMLEDRWEPHLVKWAKPDKPQRKRKPLPEHVSIALHKFVTVGEVSDKPPGHLPTHFFEEKEKR